MKASSAPYVCTGTHTASTSEDGNIQLILGPMFSGKSTELLRRLRRYKQHQKCLLIAYKVRTTPSPLLSAMDATTSERQT